MRHLNHTRLGCAAGAVGLARAARDAAVSYANQREQFGQKIGQFQMNQDLIAQMVVQEEAARLLVYRAACLADRGQPYNLEVSMAKYAAAEAAAFCADSRAQDTRRLRLLDRISRGALLSRRQVLSNRRRLGEHSKAHHRAGRPGLSEGQPMTQGRPQPELKNASLDRR